MKYLVVASMGPGFAGPKEEVRLLKEKVLPSFDQLISLEKKKKILAGGLPVGDRAFVCIMEASSNDELDQMLRTIPLWGLLDWEVTALQTFAGRAAQERNIVKKFER